VKVLEEVTKLCAAGEKIVTICERGDKLLEEEIAKVYRGKKVTKGKLFQVDLQDLTRLTRV
jgi:methionine aminopeptidase